MYSLALNAGRYLIAHALSPLDFFNQCRLYSQLTDMASIIQHELKHQAPLRPPATPEATLARIESGNAFALYAQTIFLSIENMARVQTQLLPPSRKWQLTFAAEPSALRMVTSQPDIRPSANVRTFTLKNRESEHGCSIKWCHHWRVL